MTLLTSIFHRQLVPSPLRRGFAVDFALDRFNCVKEDEHLVQRREIFVPPFACRFSKGKILLFSEAFRLFVNSFIVLIINCLDFFIAGLGGHMLGIADEDGWVQILDSRRTGSRSVIKEWNAHENAVFDIAWMEGQEMLVTASGDQTVRMWDVNRDECLAVFKGHSCSVKSVDFREDDIFIFATGARDGNVMVWDMRCNRRTGRFCQPVNVISNAHTEKVPGTPQTTKKKARRASTPRPVMNSGQQSVTSVLFQGSEKLISTGAMDGKIKIWDLRKIYTNLKQDPVPFHTFPYPGQGVRKHGFSSLVLDSTHSRLFASCTNDSIYMYSCTALGHEPICAFSGHLNSTFYVKTALSPDDMYLLSGSGDNDAYIWKVSDPAAPPFLLKGHTGEVTSVTWCPSDQGKVVTCSDDNNFRIWRMDCQVHKGDKFNVIGESYRGTSLKSNSPLNDKTSPSRHDRTLSRSPSISPHPKRILWTPPTKVITNPRLNQISSPVGMVPSNPQSPLNKTPPKMQSLQSLSPMVSASPTNLQTGFNFIYTLIWFY
ncbi:denticleless protein homolog [Orbicella faveolata]|uniref:denticleless protein homolog n=1 Tax=Orbicella faveolata TaxID=48498 RepID=UPI0009E4AF3D|nr:denticleless protein homolog [Orbicella faveolata]